MDWNRNDRDTFTVQGDLYHEECRRKCGGRQLYAALIPGSWIPTRSFPAAISWPAGKEPWATATTFWCRLTTTAPIVDWSPTSARCAIPSTWISCSATVCRRGKQLSWGLGARVDPVNNTEVVSGLTFVPNRRTDYLLTAFVQDEIGLVDRRLSLTLGTKLLRTNFTGSGVEVGAQRSSSLDADRNANRVGGVYPCPADAVRCRGELQSLRLHRHRGRMERPFSRDSTPIPDFASEQLNGYELGYRRLLGHHLYRRYIRASITTITIFSART